MTALTKTNGIHPAIADHYEGMNVALHERDKFSALATNLQNQLTVALATVDFLRTQVENVTNDRDHYMRYSFALTTRMNAMQDIWAGMLDLAKQEADKPGDKSE